MFLSMKCFFCISMRIKLRKKHISWAETYFPSSYSHSEYIYWKKIQFTFESIFFMRKDILHDSIPFMNENILPIMGLSFWVHGSKLNWIFFQFMYSEEECDNGKYVSAYEICFLRSLMRMLIQKNISWTKTYFLLSLIYIDCIDWK